MWRKKEKHVCFHILPKCYLQNEETDEILEQCTMTLLMERAEYLDYISDQPIASLSLRSLIYFLSASSFIFFFCQYTSPYFERSLLCLHILSEASCGKKRQLICNGRVNKEK